MSDFKLDYLDFEALPCPCCGSIMRGYENPNELQINGESMSLDIEFECPGCGANLYGRLWGTADYILVENEDGDDWYYEKASERSRPAKKVTAKKNGARKTAAKKPATRTTSKSRRAPAKRRSTEARR